jgi:hypothetical protein
MATHTISTGQIAASGHPFTLTANTVDTWTFSEDLNSVDIISDGLAPAFYTLDGSAPTVGGANSYLLLGSAITVDTRQPKVADVTVVKIISSSTPTVDVQRGD